jgi:hypothetical protein
MLTQQRRLSINFGVILAALLLIAGCDPANDSSDPAAPPSGSPILGEYGDAPDGGPTGYPEEFPQVGNFPTLFSSNGARVVNTDEAWLGESASAETDANDPLDPDGPPNLTNTDSDDGLTDFFISLVAIPAPTTMTVNVSAPSGSEGGNYYLNALIDLNMDGEWGGRGINGELEWVVQNMVVQVVPGVTTPYTPPAFAYSNGNLLPDGAYMRLALTKEKVPSNWDGTGEFSSGEIEDHVIWLPEFDDDDGDPGKTEPPPVLRVDCNGPYRPGQLVTCVITNRRPVAGTFTYALRHLGPGTVGVPIATCNPPPPGGPLAIGANGVVVITCNSRPGKAPDNWRLIARVVDPMAVVVAGGIHLGHSDVSISDYAFEGDPKPLNVYVGRVAGSYTHFSGYSRINIDFVVYGNDPIPMGDATVTMQMTRPDGSSESLTTVTAPDGSGRLEFDIYVYGDYTVEIVSIEGENMIYSPEMNVASELEVVVTGAASVPVGPEGIPDAALSYEINAFVAAFNTAFAEGDVAALHGLLNPDVFDRYGETACTSYLESVIGTPIQVEVVKVLSFGTWDWDMDDLVTTMDNVYTILVNVTVQGQTGQQEIHYGQLENGTLSWFTDCGDPLP